MKRLVLVYAYILVAKNVTLVDPGTIDANSLVIGGASLSGCETREIQIWAECVRVLLLSDSKVFADNPLIGASEAEEFIRNVDVSNTDWLTV